MLYNIRPTPILESPTFPSRAPVIFLLFVVGEKKCELIDKA